MLSGGGSGASAGGVTLAQDGPTRTSSAMITAGSLALRLKSTKLPIISGEMSLVATFVKVAGGGAARAKGGAAGLIQGCGKASLGGAGLKGEMATKNTVL